VAFHHFGGTFHLLRYDNLKSAVQRILRGSQREETARFIAFRSHWGYEAEFCNRARGNEKGGVEGEGGFFRRNHLVPVPVARDFEHLNELLREASRRDENRVVGERSLNVGAAMALEREHLLPLAEEGFDLAAVRFPVVNSSGCVKALTNFYSVPLAAGTEVEVKIHAAYVETFASVPDLAPGPVRGAARALLWAAAESARPGPLSGSARAEAGSVSGGHGPGAMARARTVAGQLRPRQCPQPPVP
jgi:hypothetical protein